MKELYNTIQNIDGLELLNTIPDKSIDLILTDPPYIISRTTGMDKLEKSEQFIDDDRKYAIKTDYGGWDKNFTLDQLKQFVTEFYRVLKDSGTCIIFFDIWKITDLANILTDAKFKQLRLIEWIKTNPVPINSKVNYLTNAREIAISSIKKSKPTFNSEFDTGIYEYPIYQGKDRFHPTQKSLELFENLLLKHSNQGDVVLDTFMGSATTAFACINTQRRYVGSELDEKYYQLSSDRISYEMTLETFLS